VTTAMTDQSGIRAVVEAALAGKYGGIVDAIAAEFRDAITTEVRTSDVEANRARRELLTESRCKCGTREIPAYIDGVQWYWQRHARDACTLELPNERCWCGLLRHEHVDGHADVPMPDKDIL